MSFNINFLPSFFILLFLTGHAFGQKWSVGTTSGLVLSSFHIESEGLESVWDLKAGFAFGGNLTYHVSEKIGVRTELLFERKGSQDKIFLTDVDGNLHHVSNFRFHLDYLSLPFMMEFSFGKKTKFTAHIGQSIGYLLQQTNAYTECIFGNCIPKKHFTELNRRIDFSILAGLGVVVPFTEKWALQGQVRSFAGLTDIYKDNNFEPVYNFGLLATTGVRYTLK